MAFSPHTLTRIEILPLRRSGRFVHSEQKEPGATNRNRGLMARHRRKLTLHSGRRMCNPLSLLLDEERLRSRTLAANERAQKKPLRNCRELLPFGAAIVKLRASDRARLLARLIAAKCELDPIDSEDRFGSLASFEASSSDFRYYPERRHSLALQYLSQGGHEPTHAPHQTDVHSITLSARTSNNSGIVRLSVLAVRKLMTSRDVTACWTGKSAGLAPLKILST
jgi:hypothetical protein